MHRLFRFVLLAAFVLPLIGCGVDRSVEMPENPVPKPKNPPKAMGAETLPRK